MKKIAKTLLYVLLLSNIELTKAQKVNFELFRGKQIISKVSNIRTLKELENTPRMIDVRKMAFKVEQGKVELNLSLQQRVHHIYIPQEEDYIIDTDNPLPNNDDEKSVLDGYLKMINKPLKMTIKNGVVEGVKENKFFTRLMWLGEIPTLCPVADFSGIFMGIPAETTWTDSLRSAEDKGYFINTYSLLLQENNKAKVALKGYFQPDNQTIPENQNVQNPTEGLSDIVSQEIIKSWEYDGMIDIDKTLGLIENLVVRTKKKTRIIIPMLNHQEDNEKDEILKIENMIR